MTRAMDISLFIIILTAAMSFVANIGLFTDNQLSTVSQDQITTYNVTDLNSFSNGLSANSPPSITDVIGISIYWLWEAFVIMIFSNILTGRNLFLLCGFLCTVEIRKRN